MVSVPVRAGPLLGATLSFTTPLPIPESTPWEAPAICIQATLDVAVQGQSPPLLVTVTKPLSGPATAFLTVGLIEKLQPLA